MKLLGRERELAALEELLASAAAGSGGARVLYGQRGSGLTALLEYAAASSGLRVAQMDGVEAELELPFAGLHRLCVPMLDGLERLPRRERNVLRRVLSADASAASERLLVATAVHVFLSCAAEEQPFLCAIDDAQWLDDASLEALAFVSRRLADKPIALVFATHELPARRLLDGIPQLRVGELRSDAAGDLLAAVVPGPLDARVRDRIVAEAAGFPLGLVELPAQLTPEQLAGLSALPEPLRPGDRLSRAFADALERLPSETQTLLLLVAADPEVSGRLVWAAADRLGITSDAAAPAERAGLLRISDQLAFCHPLIRLAVYDRAPLSERRRVHEALAGAINLGENSDRRAWHRSASSLAPEEEIAAELEASAARARGYGDSARAVALLERAAYLTPEPATRCRRVLAAAQAALAAGLLGRATALVGEAYIDGSDALQRAKADRLRSAIGLALGQGADRATMLLSAARAFESLDCRLARETYLEAIEAAFYAGRLGSKTLTETADAARAAPAAPTPPSATDLLLDGLALLVTAGHEVAARPIRQAIGLLRNAEEPRWLGLAALAALEFWDEEGFHDLAVRRMELIRARGVNADRGSVDLLVSLEDVLAGRLDLTRSLSARPDHPSRERSDSLAELGGPGDLLAAAWRGRPLEARSLLEAGMREGFARGLGLYVATAWQATAVLELGLGEYEAALAASREACADESVLFVVTSTLPDLVESAARAGERELAVSAVRRLARRTAPVRSEWAAGVLARSRALLEEGSRAERLYQHAIEHLRLTRAAPQLARAHLVYGEWLRRERRRREAREQLRTARDMFSFMGAQAFSERARIELAATGVRPQRVVTASLEPLTAQEAQVARLVVDGASNAEVGAQLFISPRTVEYHLHKIFRKLGISSRTQLARVLSEPQVEKPERPRSGGPA